MSLTKFGTTTNYKIPPESTGSRIQHFEHYYFNVSAMSGPFVFPSSFFTLSGVRGEIINYQVIGPGGQARLLATLDDTDFAVQNLVAGEVITINNTLSTVTANLNEWGSVISPAVNIADPAHPDRSARIDQKGALSVRFTEGEPQFDSFGLLRTTSPVRLADYSFQYSKANITFLEQLMGGGTTTHLLSESALAMDVTEAGGDSVKYTSNNYHTYTPGIGQMTIMTIAVGDSGKTNVVRRWGYYDDSDGVFFELDGNELFVVKRSSTSGTPVDTRVPQSLWNGDRVDGGGGSHNISLLNMNIDAVNIFWVDLQWLGAGQVRFGVFAPDGVRLTCHAMEHANALSVPYMASATLPVRVEQFNVGTTASPSRIKFVAAAVFSEGSVPEDYKRNLVTPRSKTFEPKTVVGKTSTMLAIFRSAAELDGVPNRKKTIPKAMHFYITGGPVKIELNFNSILALGGTGTFQQMSNDSPAEVSEDATIFVPGTQLLQQFVNPGVHTINLTQEFNSLAIALTRGAGATAALISTLHAVGLTDEDSEVVLGVDWMDI